MKKTEFEKLLFIDKINYFNNKLKEGQTVIRIREDLGVSEKGWQKEVKQNGYKYDTKSKLYINIQTTTNNKVDLLSDNQLEISNYLIDNFSILKDMLEKYKSTTKSSTISTTNKIIIDLVDDKHLNPKPKSVRINEFVYQDWQKFCEENKLYSKQELISMALKKYIECFR